jgi:hypothetical protein
MNEGDLGLRRRSRKCKVHSESPCRHAGIYKVDDECSTKDTNYCLLRQDRDQHAI